MKPPDFVPLLRCPLCDPPALLNAPVTLRCGHTVCMKHLSSSSSSSFLSSMFSSSSKAKSPLPPCPLPTCSRTAASDTPPSLPRHPDSRVNIIPPPAASTSQQSQPMSTPSSTLQVDVTVNKILSLVVRSEDWFADEDIPNPLVEDDDEHTDSEDDLYYNPDPQDSRNPLSDIPSTSLPDSASLSDPPQPLAGSRRPRSPSLLSDRPRKRSRLHPPRNRNETDASRTRSTSQDRLSASGRLEKEMLTELNCEICFGLMWQPVTTPCQHTFCSRCLQRSLDHSSTCPLCRQELPEYSYFQDNPCNKLVLAIILKGFAPVYAARGEAIRAEERDARLDTPIFVCQLCFPGMPVFLNFFEPRYRLMLRRCLETPHPCFGMIPPAHSIPHSSNPSSSNTVSQSNEFGTMLEIRNVQMLSDGQCRVEAWGTWRFRIMERGTLDGYSIARVERIEDFPDDTNSESGIEEPKTEQELNAVDERDQPDALALAQAESRLPQININRPSSRHGETSTSSSRNVPNTPSSRTSLPAPTNEELMATCHGFLEELREGTPWVVQHLNNRFVPMPEDPALFSFWMGLVLPIDEHEREKLLPIRSPRLRLRLVVHWIEQLKNNW
ncbi:PUA-like domain-containing protein [Abortiporus biennis]|nr:PUA-like domain-containing protein [Abortiporus biennis]